MSPRVASPWPPSLSPPSIYLTSPLYPVLCDLQAVTKKEAKLLPKEVRSQGSHTEPPQS